jgi:hypothetical protein
MTGASPETETCLTKSCTVVTRAMVEQFSRHLEEKMAAVGGSLTIEQLREITKEFYADGEHFVIYTRGAFTSCQRVFEQAIWDKQRKNHFGRFLVKRIATMLPGYSEHDGVAGSGEIPRRVIPGFLTAMSMLIGPEIWDACQAKAHAVIEKHRDAETGVIDWNGVYAEEAVGELVDDALLVTAHHFTQFEKRRDWFIGVVNTNLGPAKNPEDAKWRLTEDSFKSLLRSLFSNFLKEILSGSVDLQRRFGDTATQQVQMFVHHLERG